MIRRIRRINPSSFAGTRIFSGCEDGYRRSIPDRVVSASREDGDDESVSERFLGAQTLGIETFEKVVEHPVLATCEDVVMF